MEIQNVERRKFRIRIIWVTAWAWTSKMTQAQRERKHLCSELKMKKPFSSRMLCKKCREIEEFLKTLLSRGKYGKTTKIGRISCAACMLRKHEQWVYSSTMLTYWAVMTDLRFLIKLLLPRVQESQAAKLECREIHERIRVFLETFLIVNMLDEILMNYTMIQEIWQHHRESLMMLRILRKEGIENSGSEEPLQSIFVPCFSARARRKRLDDK